MSDPKSRTELALFKRRQAYQKRASPGYPLWASKREREAARLIPVGKSTCWVGLKSGRYSQPVKLGPRTTA
jgi:hypothetical protein